MELCRTHKVVKIYGTTAQFDPMVKVRTACLKRLSKILYRIREMRELMTFLLFRYQKLFKMNTPFGWIYVSILSRISV